MSDTAFAVFRYVSAVEAPGTPTTAPNSTAWSDSIGTSCVDMDTSSLVPLIPINAPTVVTQSGIFDTSLSSFLFVSSFNLKRM